MIPNFNLPRVVVVTRPTLYECMLKRHGTAGQAAFFLKNQGRSLDDYAREHDRFRQNLALVVSRIPADQRRTHITRDNLCSFLFAPDDILLVVGQDGLVPNVAKYLRGQPVIGINPSPENNDGILCRFSHDSASTALRWVNEGRISNVGFRLEKRTMAEARTDDGRRLVALNEIYAGHRTHQSSRYILATGKRHERQSSSGLICSTGTGSSGWAQSIVRQRGIRIPLPDPEDDRLAWFVREPFPSVSTGTALDHGVADTGEPLRLVSEMGEGGVLFADGIESDNLDLPAGCGVQIGTASEKLNLVVPSPYD